MPTKHRTSVSFTIRQIGLITKESHDLGITIGELVRRIVDAYFNNKK